MLEIVRYEEKYAERWDRFVAQSMNGTFLHTRNFLNYHPAGRFTDASVMVVQGSNIVAVIPACDTQDEGKRCFFSHKGSTFGGIVIDGAKYNIAVMEELFPLLEEYLRAEGYEKILLRQTGDIFSARRSELLDYYYFKSGFGHYDELSFFIDCEKLPEDIAQAMTASKRRDYRTSLKNGLTLRQLGTDGEVAAFHHVLSKNLEKFGARPIHTLEELLEFKHTRLPEQTDFYGVYLGEKLVAGSMLFYFGRQVLHTQYLAQDADYSHLFTMNFLDHEMITLAKEKGFRYFSFGISTEERGRVLNKSLAQFKEGFGCDYSVNRTYYKELCGGDNNG